MTSAAVRNADLAGRLSPVLVANRGEIAVRILVACRRSGLEGVALYSEPDEGALHVRWAARAEPIGGAAVADSYLDGEKVLAAARRVGARSVHPGYGLLSENATFARAVEQAGLVWIGPPADVIERMGDKLRARAVAEQAGVAPVPGSSEAVVSAQEIVDFAARFGWPVAVKAVAGGGGRGIRIVHRPDQAAEALAAAQREAAAAFGSAVCYLERYFASPRHVEVQVLADSAGAVVHLGERDCSVQRRHQKLIEETPSPGLPGSTRAAVTAAAVAVARASGYVGAGTVEFLWDPASDGLWFLEMNTRLQVEHPVTEAVTGIDLVGAQFAVAAGAPLGLVQEELAPSGHAIECRVNAEDPERGFVPTAGTISVLGWPGGPGVRVDAGYEAGDAVSPYYDDLLGKVVCWGRDRTEALRRMRAALGATHVAGVASTVGALIQIVDHPDFVAARHWTTWLEDRRLFPDLTAGAPPGAAGRDFVVAAGGREYPVRLFRHRPAELDGGGARSTLGGIVTAPLAGTLARVDVQAGDAVAAGDSLGIIEAMKMETPLRAPAAGRVTEVRRQAGATVAAGEVVIVLAPAGA